MYADIQGNHINYTSRGEGPPIVFIHGLGGSGNVWHGTIDALSQHHHCVAMDLRGHGRSNGKGEFTIEGFAKDVAALMRHLELPAVTLVGHSMGSLVAQHLAVTESDLIEHLVLVGGISYFQPPTADAYLARAEQVDKDGLDGLVDDWLAGAVSPQSRANLAGGIGLLRELFLRNEPASYAKSCRALASAPVIKRESIGQPTLILTGAHDRSTPLAMSEELKRSIPVSRVQVLPDVGHWSPIEAPGLVAAALLEFLS